MKRTRGFMYPLHINMIISYEAQQIKAGIGYAIDNMTPKKIILPWEVYYSLNICNRNVFF